MYQKKTKIIATIGPESFSVKTLTSMAKSGMDIARLNFSHGNIQWMNEALKNIREAEKIVGKRIGVLQDLSGPKIRTGDFEKQELFLKKGSTVKLYQKNVLGNESGFAINYSKFLKDIKKGDRIFLNDGRQELKIFDIKKDYALAKVVTGGKIRSRRGVNFPDTVLSTSSLTAKDKKDLKFGLENNLDFIALSFVQSSKDIKDLKKILVKAGSKAMIVTKMETVSAVENMDEIIKESDAVMVARGDLAVEVGPEKVPAIQKRIIEKSNFLGKPVVVATQMLESMIYSPVPTRAEVSDVSNAILDGTDAIMLSEETAMGKYPIKTVETMRNVALETEKDNNLKKIKLNLKPDENIDLEIDNVVSNFAVSAASALCAKALIAMSNSGHTARMASRFKPKQPIFVFSPQESTLRQTLISYGTYPGDKDIFTGFSDAKQRIQKFLFDCKIAGKGDKMIVLAGTPFKKEKKTNSFVVFELK